MRSERFEKLGVGWLEAGLVEQWSRGFADAGGKSYDDGYPRYRGSEGTISMPRYLARGLDVRTGERAVAVNVQNGEWEVRTESGTRESGAALLLTAPVPQSLALVEAGNLDLLDETRRELESTSYAPCLALLVLLDEPTGVPEPGGMQIKGEPLDWGQPARKASRRRRGSRSTPDRNGAASPSRPTRRRSQRCYSPSPESD